ncbi:MAG: hypothetical protein LBJ64_09175 [Deltaproteobacteria bacterium]|nr:hypothetical protein [Deltaproteobacteria bacterium]
MARPILPENGSGCPINGQLRSRTDLSEGGFAEAKKLKTERRSRQAKKRIRQRGANRQGQKGRQAERRQTEIVEPKAKGTGTPEQVSGSIETITRHSYPSFKRKSRLAARQTAI